MTGPSLPRRRAEGGFTMVELLVVVLIVGILAAIALAIFLTQQGKGQDTAAKDAARNVAGAVETCATEGDDYRACTDSADLRQTSVAFGSGQGQVEVDAPAARRYEITAHSRSGTDFVLARVASGGQARTCSHSGHGGCGADGTW